MSGASDLCKGSTAKIASLGCWSIVECKKTFRLSSTKSSLMRQWSGDNDVSVARSGGSSHSVVLDF